MGLSNDEAKSLYFEAVEALKRREFARALDGLDRLDADRPNSKHVMHQRARCLLAMQRAAEAEAVCARLEGKIEAGALAELRGAIAQLRASRPAAHGAELELAAPRRAAPPAADAYTMMAAPAAPQEARNIYTVESVFPVSVDETTVTGRVDSGMLRTGDVVTVVGPDGAPVQAPVRRIGPAETPVNLVRAGQRAVLLLGVEPDRVAPGAAIWSVTREEAYAATMVADPAAPAGDEAVPHALVEAERLMRAHDFDAAKARIEQSLTADPNSRIAHRLLARIYLDAGTHIRDPDRALEHVRRAYELGGSNDPAVLETLSEALAETGQAEQGLRFLERLNQGAQDPQARAALGGRVRDYRARYGLGHVWEFADRYGDVVFEAGDPAEIVKAIKNGALSKDAKCRRDRTGAWQSIEAALAPQHPEIAALYAAPAAARAWLFPLLAGLIAAAIVAALVLR